MSWSAYCSACKKVIAVASGSGETRFCPDCGQVMTLVAPTTSLPPEALDAPAVAKTIVDHLAGDKGPPTGPFEEPNLADGNGHLSDDLPDRVGRCEVGQRLGQGAFGDVYRTYDPQLDRDVAVKLAGRKLLTLRGHAHHIRCVSFSPDGRYLATGGDNRTVRLWETARLVPPPVRRLP